MNIFKKLMRDFKNKRAKHRIMETQGVFIPQVYTFDWEGIDKDNNTWYAISTQIDSCSFKTLDEANARLQRYLTAMEEKEHREKKIIHYVELEPKFWRILKK